MREFHPVGDRHDAFRLACHLAGPQAQVFGFRISAEEDDTLLDADARFREPTGGDEHVLQTLLDLLVARRGSNGHSIRRGSQCPRGFRWDVANRRGGLSCRGQRREIDHGNGQ